MDHFRHFMLIILAPIWSTIFVSSCNQFDKEKFIQDSKVDESWNRFNEPQKLAAEYGYETNFFKLPTGEYLLSKFSFEGFGTTDYLSDKTGGLAYRWNDDPRHSENVRINYDLISEENISSLSLQRIERLSPAEKYDLLMDRLDFPLTAHEKNRINIDPQNSREDWESLSHAWAPAVLNFLNPNPVSLTNPSGKVIPFGSSDIQMLLTHWVETKREDDAFFVGKRCSRSFKDMRERMNEEEYEAAISTPECLDVNPGALHIILTNQIYFRDQGFVADLIRDRPVFNFPVVGFKTRVREISLGKSPHAAQGTVKEVVVATVLHYLEKQNHHWYRQIVGTNTARGVLYYYKLELDEKDRIIGGQWLSEARPDFLWRAVLPELDDSFGALKNLYDESVKNLPKKPAHWITDSPCGEPTTEVVDASCRVASFFDGHLCEQNADGSPKNRQCANICKGLEQRNWVYSYDDFYKDADPASDPDCSPKWFLIQKTGWPGLYPEIEGVNIFTHNDLRNAGKCPLLCKDIQALYNVTKIRPETTNRVFSAQGIKHNIPLLNNLGNL